MVSLPLHTFNDNNVNMLVPNPDRDLRAKIGSKDVDEVSDLSEPQSVEEQEVLNESEDEECKTVPEEVESSGTFTSLQQRDLEHTEYSVLPMRKLSQSQKDDLSSESSGSVPSKLAITVSPKNLTIEDGGLVKFVCQVDGEKPIGEIDVHNFQGFFNFDFILLSRRTLVPWT